MVAFFIEKCERDSCQCFAFHDSRAVIGDCGEKQVCFCYCPCKEAVKEGAEDESRCACHRLQRDAAKMLDIELSDTCVASNRSKTMKNQGSVLPVVLTCSERHAQRRRPALKEAETNTQNNGECGACFVVTMQPVFGWLLFCFSSDLSGALCR